MTTVHEHALCVCDHIAGYHRAAGCRMCPCTEFYPRARADKIFDTDQKGSTVTTAVKKPRRGTRVANI